MSSPAPATVPADDEALIAELFRRLPRPLRDAALLNDVHQADAAHKKHRKSGSLTLVIHWDDQGDPRRVTAQASAVSYELTPPPSKA